MCLSLSDLGVNSMFDETHVSLGTYGDYGPNSLVRGGLGLRY